MENKILIVDDEQEIADLVSLYLENENFTVYKFYNAKDALYCIENETLDLAILDVMLPDMNGFSNMQKDKGEVSLSRDNAHGKGRGS